jgi:hypothetical protein
MSSCILWPGAKASNGYGYYYIRGKLKLAHRGAWEKTFGPIPSGLCVCHACDNRLCINPKHLFIGTTQANHEDMMKKGRHRVFRERIVAGMTQAKKRGTRSGKPIGRPTTARDQSEKIRQLSSEGLNKAQIARATQDRSRFRIPRASALNPHGANGSIFKLRVIPGILNRTLDHFPRPVWGRIGVFVVAACPIWGRISPNSSLSHS